MNSGNKIFFQNRLFVVCGRVFFVLFFFFVGGLFSRHALSFLDPDASSGSQGLFSQAVSGISEAEEDITNARGMVNDMVLQTTLMRANLEAGNIPMGERRILTTIEDTAADDIPAGVLTVLKSTVVTYVECVEGVGNVYGGGVKYQSSESSNRVHLWGKENQNATAPHYTNYELLDIQPGQTNQTEIQCRRNDGTWTSGSEIVRIWGYKLR